MSEIVIVVTGQTGPTFASATTIADAGGYFAATTVEGALQEEAAARVAHIADTVDAHDASAISFAPTGTIAATDVQAAVAEVASESVQASVLTTNGDVLTRAAGVPARITRSDLASDSAFTSRYVSTDTPIGGLLLDVVATERTDLAADPYPVDVVDNVLYGATVSGSSSLLWRSLDRGATWTLLVTWTTTGAVRRVVRNGDGELIVSTGASLRKSSGFAANPLTATWSTVLTTTTGASILQWGLDAHEDLVIAVEYANSPRNPSRFLWVSTDGGATFTARRDLDAMHPSNDADVHWHAACIDGFADPPRLWASYGDGPRAVIYSDDNGLNWTDLSTSYQPTVLIATDRGVAMGTDETPDGILYVERGGTTITQPYVARGLGGGGLLHQTNKGARTANGGVLMFTEPSQSGVTAQVWYSPDGGYTGKLLWEWEADGQIDFACVDDDGYVYMGAAGADATPYIIVGRLTASAAGDIVDTGGVLGGSAPGSMGLAAGAGSSVTGSGTAVGVAASAANDGAALGKSAASAGGVAVGATSTAAANSATAVGRGASASNPAAANQTAVGYLATASTNRTTAIGASASATGDRATSIGHATVNARLRSVALGSSVTATADDQVAMGGRHIEITELSADPSAPATNGARLYVKDNGSGKTQLCVRFATGAVQVIATEP